MYMIAEVSQYVAVASFAEAWIEIHQAVFPDVSFRVASFAEAWIEISKYYHPKIGDIGRLLRGGVD